MGVSLPLLLSKLAVVSQVQCIEYVRIHDGPLASPFTVLPLYPSQEAAKAAVLVLQSIFSGSEGMNVTPSPVKKAIQESKQGKPKVDCTYCTGKSGLNLWTEEMDKRVRIWVSVEAPKICNWNIIGA